MPHATVNHPVATLARQVGDDFVVTYHDTDVVIIRRNGDIVINTGGWYTKTTTRRINQYAPGVGFFVKHEIGYVTYKGRTYTHYEGMVLHPNGSATLNGDAIDPI